MPSNRCRTDSSTSRLRTRCFRPPETRAPTMDNRGVDVVGLGDEAIVVAEGLLHSFLAGYADE